MSAVDTLVEPVAWRVRAYPGHTWQIVERILPHFPQDWEKQPLVPASALEASEAKIAALTAERDALREERKDRERQIRVSEYRRAVEWLHSRAKIMSDPHTKAVLNLAGDALGRYRARALRQEGKP